MELDRGKNNIDKTQSMGKEGKKLKFMNVHHGGELPSQSHGERRRQQAERLFVSETS
jgi:hypothetical protein